MKFVPKPTVCMMHEVPCPHFRKLRDEEDKAAGRELDDWTCPDPATHSFVEPCPLHGGHTVWFCAEHYEWIMRIRTGTILEQ